VCCFVSASGPRVDTRSLAACDGDEVGCDEESLAAAGSTQPHLCTGDYCDLFLGFPSVILSLALKCH